MPLTCAAPAPSVDGGGAVAFVSAFDDPAAAIRLEAFSRRMGLANADLTVVYASGVRPAFDAGWARESAAEVQMAHLAAPRDRLYLVEASSDDPASLDAAVAKAYQLIVAAGGGRISLIRHGETRLGARAERGAVPPSLIEAASSGRSRMGVQRP